MVVLGTGKKPETRLWPAPVNEAVPGHLRQGDVHGSGGDRIVLGVVASASMGRCRKQKMA